MFVITILEWGMRKWYYFEPFKISDIDRRYPNLTTFLINFIIFGIKFDTKNLFNKVINKFVQVNVVEKRYEMLMITLLISLNILINTYRFRSLFFEKKYLDIWILRLF